MRKRKRFGSNEEVISETEVYFQAKDRSFYKKDWKEKNKQTKKTKKTMKRQTYVVREKLKSVHHPRIRLR